MNKEEVTGIIFPIWTTLGFIFLTLKLTGTITWSWWWVLAPFWIPAAIFVLVFIIMFIIAI